MVLFSFFLRRTAQAHIVDVFCVQVLPSFQVKKIKSQKYCVFDEDKVQWHLLLRQRNEEMLNGTDHWDARRTCGYPQQLHTFSEPKRAERSTYHLASSALLLLIVDAFGWVPHESRKCLVFVRRAFFLDFITFSPPLASPPILKCIHVCCTCAHIFQMHSIW